MSKSGDAHASKSQKPRYVFYFAIHVLPVCICLRGYQEYRGQSPAAELRRRGCLFLA